MRGDLVNSVPVLDQARLGSYIYMYTVYPIDYMVYGTIYPVSRLVQ